MGVSSASLTTVLCAHTVKGSLMLSGTTQRIICQFQMQSLRLHFYLSFYQILFLFNKFAISQEPFKCMPTNLHSQCTQLTNDSSNSRNSRTHLDQQNKSKRKKLSMQVINQCRESFLDIVRLFTR